MFSIEITENNFDQLCSLRLNTFCNNHPIILCLKLKTKFYSQANTIQTGKKNDRKTIDIFIL